jgi:hypothetical protein
MTNVAVSVMERDTMVRCSTVVLQSFLLSLFHTHIYVLLFFSPDYFLNVVKQRDCNGPTAVAVGICFDEQIVSEGVPVAPHDR